MNFDWTTFLLEILNFFILLWILQRFLYRPVIEVIQARQRNIQATLEDARRLEAEAVTTRAALVAHRDMIVTVRDRVAKAMSEGRTLEQIVALKPTADLDARTGNAAQSADRFVQQLHAELLAAR